MPNPQAHTPLGSRHGTLKRNLFKTAVIEGGAAGNHTVTGIQSGDELAAVVYFPGAGVDVTDVQDLLAEFSISALSTINNAGGTSTAGGKLWITWIDRT